MKHLIWACAVLVVAAGSAWAQNKPPQNISPFGEAATYELTNIISLQSTFGTSTLRDVVTTANGGTVSLDGGYLEVKADSQNNSTADLSTVNRGQYQPGKGAETGMGLIVNTAPTNDGVAEWGLGDGDNGAFWRLKGNGDFCVIYERADTEQEFCEGSLNGEDAGRVDPVNEAYVYVIRFNWYGVGGASWFAYRADAAYETTLQPLHVHTFVPDNGQAMEDPNQPIFAFVDSASTTTQVEVEVGGRRYDVQGRFRPPRRLTGQRREGQSVASADGYVPLVCVQRENPFPASGRQNSVNAFIAPDETVIESNNDIDVVYTTGGTLTGASFADPDGYDDGDTALEFDTSATAISGQTRLAGPFRLDGGKEKKVGPVAAKGETIPLVGTDPTCILGEVNSDSTVDTYLNVREEW